MWHGRFPIFTASSTLIALISWVQRDKPVHPLFEWYATDVVLTQTYTSFGGVKAQRTIMDINAMNFFIQMRLWFAR
jgi:hypothetical protein